MRSRRMQLVLVVVLVASIGTGLVASWYVMDNSCTIPVKASVEIQHVINCQDPETGAINDVFGEPTWVVPGEMALAAIALQLMGHAGRALNACRYLAAVQDPVDGGWFNQYNRYAVVDNQKHARHAAQVLMAFHWCQYDNATAIEAGIGFLLTFCHTGRGGDGLVRGGKDGAGSILAAKWLSDNVFAAKAFEYHGRPGERSAIIASIDAQFLVPGKHHWYQYKDGAGTMHEGNFGWINLAPPMFGLDCSWPAGLVDTIKARLQGADGSILEHEASTKKMPGIGLQVHMALREIGAGDDVRCAFYRWLARSGLLQAEPDANGDAGGIVDWVDDVAGTRAQWWERFIDTSAFTVFNEKDFRF